MTGNNQAAETGYSLSQAKRLVAAYSHATGIGCRVIDNRGKTLCELCGGSCSECGCNQIMLKKRFHCADAHLYGGYQAERFGGRYIFFCPIGLTHWASPIAPDGRVEGYLIGGPVLMVDPEEFLLDDLTDMYAIDEPEKQELADFIRRVPVIKPEFVHDLSELLFSVALQISSGAESRFEEHARRNTMQARISETVHAIKSAGLQESKPPNYPFEKEKELLSAISLGDKPTSQRLLNELLGYIFFSTGSDLAVMKSRIREMVVLLSRAAIEGGANSEEIFGLNNQYLADIDQYQTFDELTFWLSKVLARFTDCVFNLAGVRHKDAIFKALSYIKAHYMNKLTLEEVADYVYLNPSYFSKIFKEEMDCSFVSYVNKYRVEMSKSLLFDVTVPLTDVSSLVGFEEQCYFTKVFKKLTGTTPGSYRTSMGKKLRE